MTGSDAVASVAIAVGGAAISHVVARARIAAHPAALTRTNFRGVSV
ncbi:MAG: hypothetical protein QOC87_2237, partial [Actinomycetota bacterium]|nr:hypothetical protein [Actinomycetota bacterium]